MLTIKKSDKREYQDFIDNTSSRVIFNQIPEFLEAKKLDGTNGDFFIVYDGDKKVAGSLVIYYRFKKIFFTAMAYFGPLVEDEYLDRYAEILGLLKKAVFKNLRVRRFIINPPLAKNVYKDIDLIESDVNGDLVKAIESKGFVRINKEYYEDASVPIRFFFSKDIRDMDYKGFLASTSSVFRNRIGKYQKDNIKVRMIDFDELEKFDEMQALTYARVETNNQVRPLFYRTLYKGFGEKIFFPLVYMDCDDTIDGFRKQEAVLDLDLAKLEEKYAEKDKDKKYQNKKAENIKQRENLESKIKEIESLRAEKGNIIDIYSGCFIISGKDMIYFLGGGDDRYFSFNGASAMHDYMVKIALENKLQVYNLFGCSGILDDSAPDAGVLKFKRTFNGYLEEFIGTYIVKR